MLNKPNSYFKYVEARKEVDRLRKIKSRAVAQEKERYEAQMRELQRTGLGPGGIPLAREAGVDGLPFVGNYPVRGHRDVVLSGPVLGKGTGPGRKFSSPEAALSWARGKYGEGNVSLLNYREEMPRWAVLVKNLRK